MEIQVCELESPLQRLGIYLNGIVIEFLSRLCEGDFPSSSSPYVDLYYIIIFCIMLISIFKFNLFFTGSLFEVILETSNKISTLHINYFQNKIIDGGIE